jgi:mRNA-degrading endonuclease RelE of RelBE toxin-antitoxin system
MLTIEHRPEFFRKIERIKDNGLKEKIQKQVMKIISSPETGKPMRYARKGTREVYVPPFRLSYAHIPQENKIIFLDIYHKDEQ